MSTAEVGTIEEFMRRLPNDVGGLPSPPFERVEHELKPWEKRCHAMADVLDFHKIINTEEKRRGVEALGAQMIGKLGYYERWLTAFAVILFQKGVLSPTALAEKMAEVAARSQLGSGQEDAPVPGSDLQSSQSVAASARASDRAG